MDSIYRKVDGSMASTVCDDRLFVLKVMRTLFLIALVFLAAPMASAQSLAEQLGESPTMEELQALYQKHYDKWVEDIQSQQGLESPHWPEFPAVSFYPFFAKAARAGEKDAMDWVLM